MGRVYHDRCQQRREQHGGRAERYGAHIGTKRSFACVETSLCSLRVKGPLRCQRTPTAVSSSCAERICYRVVACANSFIMNEGNMNG